MGVAYYLEFDKDILGTDFTDGKSVARAMDKLNEISKNLGIRSLEDFMGQSVEELSDLLGEEIEGSPELEKWFEPKEGIEVIEKLIGVLNSKSITIKNLNSLVEDLESYKEALFLAEKNNAKWHLAIDF